MHRSKLAGFIIDCKTDDLAQAADFWSAALGLPQRQLPSDEGSRYVRLQEPRLHIEVQRVEHESRVHLDIEASDVEAEARRLTALGAKRIGNVRTWIVMEAPTGQRFCVVRVQSADFETTANRWE